MKQMDLSFLHWGPSSQQCPSKLRIRLSWPRRKKSRRKKGETARLAEWTEMAMMWKAGQLCLLFFPSPVKASLAQGQSTCTSSCIFIFFTWVLLFTKGAVWKEKALLLPETLQTWLEDDFIPCKISISPLAVNAALKKDTHQDTLWPLPRWEVKIFAF